MKVLSLFDGISCGMVALERANIPVDRYISYEIDKNAIKVSKQNYPKIEHKGDVFNAKYNEGDFDLLIGGSPCTYWSNARAKGTGRELTPDGVGGKLFMEYVRALKEAKPKFFIYENNNSMAKEIKYFISRELGVEPILINSELVSGQIRRRLYWTNIPNVTQPKDKGINLIDCLDKYVDDKYYLGEKMIKYAMSSGTKSFYVKPEINTKKARPLTTAPNKRAGTTTYISDDFVNGGDSKRIRRLTPVEYERLQTLPENYTQGISDAQRYKTVGNGWTVDVISHILSYIFPTKAEAEKKLKELEGE
jgi:DNA (cytosine-5)-methyltransferase 3A